MMLLPTTAILVAVLSCGSHACSTPCNGSKGSSTNMYLHLPQTFKARIEVKDMQMNTTTLIEEYYDMASLKMGMITEFRNKDTSTQILDYNQNIIINYGASLCWIHPLDSKSRLEVPFKSLVDIFNLKNHSFQDIANTEIHGIPVKNIRFCICEHELNATIDYYLQNVTSILSLETNIPVRVEMKGTVHGSKGKLQPFTYIYEFLTFDPTPVIDEKVFQIPMGVVCNESIYYKSLPNILPQFTAHGEVINSRNQRLSVFNILFDWDEKLMRTEFYPEIHRNTSSSSDRAIRFITDFKLGIHYVLDSIYKPCLVKPATSTPLELERLSWTNVLHMDDIYSLMNLDSHKFKYKGKLNVRGLLVDVWAKRASLGGGIMIHREYYFLNATHVHVPIGIYQKAFNSDKEVINESWLHLYGYVQGHVHLDNFNIEKCFFFSDRIYINFRLDDKFDIYIKGYQSLVFPALRNSLAKAANISSVRISDIQIGRLSPDLMIVHFTLLDAPVIPDSVIAKYKPILLQKAYSNLKSHKEIEFKVMYPLMEEKVFRFETAGLESLVRDYSSISSVTPTKGAMVGLGLGMLFLGACSGLMAGYFIYRRILTTDVPYELTK